MAGRSTIPSRSGEPVRGGDAGFGLTVGRAVPLCRPGAAGSAGASAAGDPGDGERGAGALGRLSGDFAALYSGMGWPSIAPEMLLRGMLLQAFYSVGSERQLIERLEFDLLFRWFVGLGLDDPVWGHSTFSNNRDRLLVGDIAARFLSALLSEPRVERLLSSEHSTVDGTLIQAWALQNQSGQIPPLSRLLDT